MVLVLGGTSDSIKICDLINKRGFCNRYILSVTTEYGKKLAEGVAKKIHLGKKKLNRYLIWSANTCNGSKC